jgi:hypothetical protein
VSTATLNIRQIARPSPTITNDGDRLVAQCISDDENDSNGAFRTVFNKESCVLAFIGRSSTETVDDVILKELWWSKAQYPHAVDEPKFSLNVCYPLLTINRVNF